MPKPVITLTDEDGLRGLMIDGGEIGTTEFSQVVIVEELLYRLTDEEHDEDPLLTDVFDFISGSGLGGAIVILAVSLNLPMNKIAKFYLQLHRGLFCMPCWQDPTALDPEGNVHKIQQLFRELLSDYDLDGPIIVKNQGKRQCRAFLCAINTQAPYYPYLFTTYEPEARATTCTIIEALQIAFTDGIHLPAVSLGKPGERFVGTVHRFSDGVFPLMQELRSLFGYSKSISCLVSVGPGYPATFATPESQEICQACTDHAARWEVYYPPWNKVLFRFCLIQPKDRDRPHALEILKTDSVHYLYDALNSYWFDCIAKLLKEPKSGTDFQRLVYYAEYDYGNRRILPYNQDDFVQKVQKWLSPVLSTFKTVANIRERREPGTSQWFIDSEIYDKWVQSDVPLFILRGISGAGKTFLSHFVYETLSFKIENDPTILVLGCFLPYDGTACANDILSTMLAQTFVTEKNIPPDIRSFYKTNQPLSESQLKKAIASQLVHYEKVFIVIDALDEFTPEPQVQKGIIETFLNLGPHVRLFVTTDPDVPIDLSSQSTEYDLTDLERPDIRQYAYGFLKRQSRLRSMLHRDRTLFKRIADPVITESLNMFLLARFHIDQVSKCRNALEVFEELEDLEKDVGEAYKGGVVRLNCQDERDARRALHAVMWVAYARRPLHVEELLMAVGCSTEDITAVPVEYAMVDEEVLMSLIGGLIVICDSQVSLLHKIIYDHYKNDERNVFDDGSWTVAMGCLKYLISDRSEDSLLDEKAAKGNTYAKLLADKKRDWFAYCAQSWGHYAVHAQKKLTAAHKYFDHPVYRESLEHLLVDEWAPHKEGFTPLHMTSYFGVEQLIEWLLAKEADTDINARDAVGATPLHCAAKMGNLAAVKLLTQQVGIECSPLDRDGKSPIKYAQEAGKDEVVEYLEKRRV